jgi:hypothetical protein
VHSSQTNTVSESIPQSFGQLIKEIFKGFFRNFFSNFFKAAIASAFALYLPRIIQHIQSQDWFNNQIIVFLRDFAISKSNMLKGCLLSSAAILTLFSLIGKIRFLGFFSSIKRFIGGAFGYLNIFRNSATSAFSWGFLIALIAGQFIDNPLITLTLVTSTFLSGVVPQSSGMAYFLRFFWNRFYSSTILKTGLRPADEFIRGSSPGFAIALILKNSDMNNETWMIIFAVIAVFLLTGHFRQKRAKVSE